MELYKICDCSVDCGKLLAKSTRRKHRQKVHRRALEIDAQLALAQAELELRRLELEEHDALDHDMCSSPRSSIAPVDAGAESEIGGSDMELDPDNGLDVVGSDGEQGTSNAGGAGRHDPGPGAEPDDDHDVDPNLFDFRNAEDESDVEDLPARAQLPIEDFLQLHLDDQLRQQLHDYDQRRFGAEELRNLKMAAIKLLSKMSRNTYNWLYCAFSDELGVENEHGLYKLLSDLSQVQPQRYDCCVNSCCAFSTPELRTLDKCPHCDEPRFDTRGRPRQEYLYLPIIPRLQGFFSNAERAEILSTYRHNYQHVPGDISDVFDSAHYMRLRETNVEVRGEVLPHHYFDQPTDVFLGHSVDGVSLFKRRRNACTATPIITIIYNLPPDVRNRYANIVINAIIPGPKAPKDQRSFVFPMLVEAHHLARGVRTLNAFTRDSFYLRAYWVRILADMIAMNKVLQITGATGYRSCRRGELTGVRDVELGGGTYYNPLMRPITGGHPREIIDYGALRHRSHADVLACVNEIETQQRITAANELKTLYGITGRSYLFELPGMDFNASAPHERMHVFFENIAPMLHQIWASRFDLPNNQREPDGTYGIPKHIWQLMGKEMRQAVKTIPSQFVRAMPDMYVEFTSLTAEDWCFWVCWLGPILLHNRLDARYYNHFIRFSKIVRKSMQLTLTDLELDELEDACSTWVRDYERLYYRGDVKRLPFCTSNIHSMLHLVEEIRESGPVWALWSFVMERVCGIITRCVTSRLHPYGTLNQRIKREAQLTHIIQRFGLVDSMAFLHAHLQQRDDETVLSNRETIVDGYPATVLRSPSQRGFVPDRSLLVRVAKWFTTMFEITGYQHVIPYLPEVMPRYDCVRRIGGDRIRGSVVPLKETDRDSSWVRFEVDEDRLAHRPNAPPQFESRVFYGIYHFSLVVHLEPFSNKKPRFGLDAPRTFVLAHVTPVTNEGKDATKGLVWYEANTNMQALPSVFVDIQAIKCAVGRVPSRSRVYILDRSEGLSQPGFQANDD